MNREGLPRSQRALCKLMQLFIAEEANRCLAGDTHKRSFPDTLAAYESRKSLVLEFHARKIEDQVG